MDLLACTVMPYAWGSRTSIAELCGRPSPTATPEAELWMGAHPVAASRLVRGGTTTTLDAVVAASPERELGAGVVDELGPRLPFLLKVLAAAEPLSLQAHPTTAQAERGFAEEEARAIPLGAPTRNYRDRSHKPELLCALGPFDALSGFRSVADMLSLFDALAVPDLVEVLLPLRSMPDGRGIARTFAALMTVPKASRPRLVHATLAAARALQSRGDTRFASEVELVLRLATKHPGDVGIVSALLLEHHHLQAGDAIYLAAGNLHAYLEGTAVEVMASSDNVLRGGLTEKHVDVAELIRILDYEPSPTKILRPRVIDDVEDVYDTPAREFRLSRLRVDGAVERVVTGPEILLVTEGAVRSGDLPLPRGTSVFVPATDGSFSLRGLGTVFRARTNL